MTDRFDDGPREYLGTETPRLSLGERWRAAVALVLNRPLPPYLKVKDYRRMRMAMSMETWAALGPVGDVPLIQPRTAANGLSDYIVPVSKQEGGK